MISCRSNLRDRRKLVWNPRRAATPAFHQKRGFDWPPWIRFECSFWWTTDYLSLFVLDDGFPVTEVIDRYILMDSLINLSLWSSLFIWICRIMNKSTFDRTKKRSSCFTKYLMIVRMNWFLKENRTVSTKNYFHEWTDQWINTFCNFLST